MRFYRFEVSIRPGLSDPRSDRTRRTLDGFGFGGIENVKITQLFTIGLQDTETHGSVMAKRIAAELLTDQVSESCRVFAEGDPPPSLPDANVIEVHFKPGVMDNAAQSTLRALADMGINAVSVATARRFEIRPRRPDRDIRRLARLLGNDCTEEIVVGVRPVAPPPSPPVHRFALRHIAIRDLDDSGLHALARQAHLFLSVGEMQAIRDHYRTLGRDPTDLELEALAQTWSEHCIHKTLRSAVEYRGASFPSFNPKQPSVASAAVRYDNLLKETIVKATEEVVQQRRGPTCLSVFRDNAGVIAFDERWGVAFKVETHNHPSAIEPYGGAATGIGGVIRDILGCGLGAKPIADTDVFCVAPPDWPVDAVPKGVIHPESILSGIVAGVRDYGNRMGIPTVNGAIHFDPRYLGNPLVFCGCVGLIPRDRLCKNARSGDLIVLIGGRTGRDGIHGATFSSAELTDGHEEEFAHAVQIGNAIEEKKILDVILQARDYPAEPTAAAAASDSSRCLYSAITDCGAGGLSSAVGEMAAEIGAEVDLEKVPLKYAGLRYDEIWISEAQERMVLAVPPQDVDALLALAASEDVEATIIGRFTDTSRLVVRYQGVEVGDLDLQFLHHGLPKAIRQAEWQPSKPTSNRAATVRERSLSSARGPLPTDLHPENSERSRDHDCDLAAELLRRLADPTTASKHWVIRQYDHEVQAGSVIKPLVGCHDGPSDASVIRPRLNSNRGIAIGCGLAPHLADIDPYMMAVAAIDEALRNVVSVGGDPNQTAILDNFCWPRADDARNLGALVRACQACYDVATAYGLPFISGKDSLNNEFALDPADVDLVRRTIGDMRIQWHGRGLERPCSSAAHPDWWHGRGLERPRSPAASHQQTWPPQAAAMPHSDLDLIVGGRLSIPYTLLISAISLVDDVDRCVSMDLKQEHADLYLIGQPSTLESGREGSRPLFDLAVAAETHQAVARMIHEGLVRSVHDVSEGGLLVACAEMAMAAGRSCRVHGFSRWSSSAAGPERSPRLVGGHHECEEDFYFSESPALYIVEAALDKHERFSELAAAIPSLLLATISPTPAAEDAMLEFDAPSGLTSLELANLRRAWRGPLDW